MPPNPNHPQIPNIQRIIQALSWIKRRLRIIFAAIRWLILGLLGIFVGVFNFLRREKRDRILAIIFLLISAAIIVGYYYFPGSYNFEGSIVAQGMSFTYIGQQEKLILNTIRDIKNLDIQGRQPQALVLRGQFYSKSNPTLNQKLSQLKQLTVELPYATSRLILTPANLSKSELSISEFRLLHQSRVSQLVYEPKNNQMSLCLQSATLPPETCLFPEEFSDKLVLADKTSLGSLKVQLGQQELIVSLAGINLPELGIRSVPDVYQELLLQFKPNIDEFLFSLLTPTYLSIKLPDTVKLNKSTVNDPADWFRRDLEVSEVSFSRFDMTGYVKDELQISTILEGKLRMGAQMMDIQPEQFLIIPPGQKGVHRLRTIRINPQSPQGLQTLISGESNSISVGLYPEFPVQTIKPTWLSKYLSQEGINALLAFIGAFTAILYPRLFPESPQTINVSQQHNQGGNP
ncbi:hypothetical protein H1Q63_10215 [Desmonostoc muscorum CCALA 125]|nr:hypothetical protein [Desmonostoc muscorum CCALA 125]